MKILNPKLIGPILKETIIDHVKHQDKITGLCMNHKQWSMAYAVKKSHDPFSFSGQLRGCWNSSRLCASLGRYGKQTG